MKISGIKNTEKYRTPSKVFSKIKDDIMPLGFVTFAAGRLKNKTV